MVTQRDCVGKVVPPRASAEGHLGGPQLVLEEDVAVRDVRTFAGGLAFAALYSAELRKLLPLSFCTLNRIYLGHWQVTPKPVLWALLLALLGTALPAQPRACSVPDVLRHYQAVIFEDLQAAARRAGPGDAGDGPGSRHLHFVQKNQTDAVAPGRRGRVGPSCGAQKEHSILVSIAALGRALRGAVAGDPRGALERAAWTVALRTEAVMRRHCRPLRQPSRQSWWARPRPQRHRGRRRRLLLRALDAVATCWEKLFALRALGSRGP
ncbi:uncharacterized protein C20orf204 homolog [Myotis yumanensis]|uniref:uncharacterized protein C20orf204 homolog n=1 Tax=Myotis yumanensis TaxID=159337 RepID=UPI0038D1A5EA